MQRDAFCASGASPTIHLLGAGQVGSCFLDLCAQHGLHLVSVSDTSGTVYAREGLPAAALAGAKRAGHALADVAGAEPLSLEAALAAVDADVIVDCLPSDLHDCAAAAARVRRLLDAGKTVILASKAALLGDTAGLLEPGRRERLGICALLGGTGLALLRELDELRARTKRILCVPNATTTLLAQELEAGRSWEDALGLARTHGLLETDPRQDLDGRDAALKLTIVARAVLQQAVEFDDVARPCAETELRAFAKRPTAERTPRAGEGPTDAQAAEWPQRAGEPTAERTPRADEVLADALHAERRQRASEDPAEAQAADRPPHAGAPHADRTLRLVGHATRDAAPWLAFEELPRASALAIPWQRVAYGYELDDGSLRLHVGDGVGPLPTAEAALRDYFALYSDAPNAKGGAR